MAELPRAPHNPWPVIVEWTDATRDSRGWAKATEHLSLDELHSAYCVTVGFLIGENDEWYAIAQSKERGKWADDALVTDTIWIPKRTVDGIAVLATDSDATQRVFRQRERRRLPGEVEFQFDEKPRTDTLYGGEALVHQHDHGCERRSCCDTRTCQFHAFECHQRR